MGLEILDFIIILSYFILVLIVGFMLSSKARKNLDQYFLGGNKIKWYLLGLSNASGMFDISGVMWTVTIYDHSRADYYVEMNDTSKGVIDK